MASYFADDEDNKDRMVLRDAVLERLGHAVECPESPACCGQPAFNAGCWEEARAVTGDAIVRLSAYESVVVGSGSCAAMMKVFSQELFADDERLLSARDLAARTWEFSDFLVSRLGVEDVGARFPARVTIHDGCHGLRELGLKRPIRALLARVKDLELVERALRLDRWLRGCAPRVARHHRRRRHLLREGRREPAAARGRAPGARECRTGNVARQKRIERPATTGCGRRV